MDGKSVLLIRWWFLLFGVISSLVLELHAQSGRYTIYQEVSGTLTICNNLVVNNVDASATNVSTVLENNILGENTTVLMDNQQDFTIKPGSVAVNAGDNTCVTWLNGMSREKRRQQNVVDIGAFEVYYKYEDTLFTIFQEMAGALTLCNNIIINNVADSLTNVVSIPINNITGENTQVFTDNYLDFSIKPGSSAVNAGERLYVNWSYDMCREKRTQQDRVDIGAFETYYRHEDTLYLIYHEGVNTLSFCNNLIIINVADSLTNVTTMPANNITGEEISVFTDNYLDFGLKPGSIAVNSGEDECPIWGRDLRGLYRKWGVVDVGAYEAKSLIGAGYTVEQEDLGTLLLYNNIVIQNPGSIGACNINAVDSSINLLNDVGNVFVGNDDYSLGETSPAVNMGDNQYVVFLNDMKGESRIACEEPVDLGAYEVQALHNIYLTDVVCGVGQPYHRYGFDIDSVPAGETTFTRSVMSGLVCDSAYQLTLTVNPSYLYQDNASICENEAYVWSGHEHVTIGQLPAGYYIYWDSLTTSAYACDSVYFLNLTVHPLPQEVINAPSGKCINDTIELSLSGQHHYLWNSPVQSEDRTSAVVHVTQSQTTTYSVRITSDFGCSIDTSTTVIAYPLPSVYVSSSSYELCDGGQLTLTASSHSECNYLWNTGDTAQQISVNAPGEYTVQATSNGCTAVRTVTVQGQQACTPIPCPAPDPSTMLTGDTTTHYFNDLLYNDLTFVYDSLGYIIDARQFKGDTMKIQCGKMYKFYVEANGIYEWNTDISHNVVPTYDNEQLRTKITLFYDDFQTSAIVSDRAVNSQVPGCAAAGLSWWANYTGVVGIMVTRGDVHLDTDGDFCTCNEDTLLLRYDQRREPGNTFVIWGRYGTVRELPCDNQIHYIFDSGTNSQLMDASGDYSNNEDGYLVLYPGDIRSKLKLWGASILDCGDTLFIYNGNIEENPNLVPIEAITGPNARYLGTEDAPLFMSSIPGVPITLRMKSNSSCTRYGLELQAKCCQNPGLPQNLHGVMTSDTTTFLTWEPGEGNELVYNWELFRASDNVMLLSGSTYSSEVMLDGLDPNESYYFTISVVSACSNDTASSEGVDVMYSNVFMMEPPAQCPEFTDLSAPGVKCQYGSFANPLQYTGIAVGRHTVITQQGSDPNTGHQLPFLPPGESAVVKLGNERTGAEAEAVTYQFTVDPDYAILLLKFAVVLEDPGHPSPDQPRFVVRVLNNDGQLVETCAEYDVTAAGNIPGFLTYSSGRRPVRWRPWTNVGIDLTDYAGQQVKLQFVTYDCDWHGHFGYAYYTASCIDNNLALAGCNGNQMTLVAPSGFESYQWDNGSTSTTATYTVNGTTSANCLITSATGCQFTLSGTLSSDPGLPTVSSTVYDTICEGDNYNQHFFNLPPQFELGTHTFRNTFFDVLRCTGGDVTTTLFLTVLPRYNHIYDAVCQGMDYNAHGFHYTSLQTGNYTDTLVTELPTGCDLIKILHLTVSPSFNMANTLTGENSVCRNEVYSYALQNAEGLGTFHWNVPVGVNILYGQGTSEVNLYFTDDAPNPANISLIGANGCGSGSIPLSVTHYPSYHIFYQDTLCSGNEYHHYGFNLARQDSTGWYTFIDRYTTVHGCDSVRILQLLVTGTPTLTTLAQPSEICLGQGTMVNALGENARYTQSLQFPIVRIGDIYCTDGSVVRPSDWPCGKVAHGVVFYVDSTGQHGWMVHLHNQSTSIQWGGGGTDIPTLTNYNNGRDAIFDLDGYTNTQKIRNAGTSSTYPAAWNVDFENGWYLPSVGQLNLLFPEIVTINASLQIVNGTLFPINTYFWYWSSTEYDQTYAWKVSMGATHFDFKTGYNAYNYSRSVKTF